MYHLENPYFVYTNRSLSRSDISEPILQIVNCVSAVLQISWKETVRAMVNEAKALHRLPDDEEVTAAFLLHSGFALQKMPPMLDAADLILYANAHDTAGECMLIQFAPRHSRAFAALMPHPEHGYRLFGVVDPEFRQPDQVWLYHPKRRVKSAVPTAPFRVKNDEFSLIEALSVLLGISTGETLDALAESGGFQTPCLSKPDVFTKLLTERDFVPHAAFTKDDRPLQLGDFCTYIRDMFPKGTNILAQIAYSHRFAAVRVAEDACRVLYTPEENARIAEFWTQYPKRRERRTQKEPEITLGAQMRHPQYGTGEITKIDERLIEVTFPQFGVKRFPPDLVKKRLVK